MLWILIPYILPLLLLYLSSGPGQVIAIQGALPQLSLVVLVYYGNSRNAFHGELIGLLIGLTADVLGAAPLGFYSFSFTLVGYLAGISRGKVYIDAIFTPVLMVGVFIFLKAFISFLLAGIFGFEAVQEVVFNRIFFISLLYSLLLTPILFAVLKALDKILPRRLRGGYQD
ncbi:rod shape-determining protein MreD [Salinispira pacifica]|uniref:Rod shape-determining protein MreD n=1 Tax=Salinispira pacifica TaxID=1307761 RepID=V5WHY5_9SPIO|nr:rod shape-determining protein MreD [Salinispira pacifica]AHC15154.1 rod shape-determining protein MreD [Salinispira pacifica]